MAELVFKPLWLQFLSVKTLIEKWILIPYFILSVIWVVVLSPAFPQPNDYRIDPNGLVTFSRQVPWEAVSADYYVEIVSGNGFKCHPVSRRNVIGDIPPGEQLSLEPR